MWPTKLHTYMAKKKKKTERRTGEKARKYEWSEKGNGNTMGVIAAQLSTLNLSLEG